MICWSFDTAGNATVLSLFQVLIQTLTSFHSQCKSDVCMSSLKCFLTLQRTKQGLTLKVRDACLSCVWELCTLVVGCCNTLTFVH